MNAGRRIATIAGMRLGHAGVAFELSDAPRNDRRVVVGSWVVEARAASRVLVARGRAKSYAAVLRAALPRAESGLDLLSVRGMEDLTLATPTREHVAWWTKRGAFTTRIVSWTTPTVSIGEFSVTVRDAAGRLVRPARASPPSWHASYRYFRLSQTTPDLFDAYRNAYLALESVLSTIAPQRLIAPGREFDREWFMRALRATGVDLAPFVATGTARPELSLYDELYLALRVTVFHAKTNRRTLLPRDEPNRRLVLAGLERLRRLYLAIAESTFGMRRLGGGVTAHAARLMLTGLFDHLRIFVTSDESPLDVSVPPRRTRNRAVIELADVEPAKYEGFSASRLARASFSDIQALEFVRRGIGASAQGESFMATVLEGRLVLPSAGELEVLFGATMMNARELRQTYA